MWKFCCSRKVDEDESSTFRRASDRPSVQSILRTRFSFTPRPHQPTTVTFTGSTFKLVDESAKKSEPDREHNDKPGDKSGQNEEPEMEEVELRKPRPENVDGLPDLRRSSPSIHSLPMPPFDWVSVLGATLFPEVDDVLPPPPPESTNQCAELYENKSPN